MINKNIIEQVVIYRKQKRKKIKLSDAIMLATSKYLVSDDWDDFTGIDDWISSREWTHS